jgi:hypothetical protein
VSDPNLQEVVPPFRFKAGGWELFRPSIELGSAMKARIAEKGFFLIRVNQDQTGGPNWPISHSHCRAGNEGEGEVTEALDTMITVSELESIIA